MTEKHAIIAIVIMAAVTAALRFAPFLLMSGNKKETPKVIKYLGRVIPYAAMAMLVVYCLRDITFTSAAGYLPCLIASAVVVLTYVWRKNTLLSIIGGTLCYMALVQFVFI